ncbi:MAG: P-loop NTPase [Gammaproteobacteria bacterium]|nr:P-loop NTPase [Gammaproteobacteria bacterium]
MIGPEAAIYEPIPFDRDEFTGSPVQVIAIAGGKGGVGKSSLAVNLAIALAEERHRVLLMDANLGMANIDVLLNLKAEHNLSHVIHEEKQLQDIILDGPGGIKIVPAASGISKMAKLSSAENAALVNAFSTLPYDIDTLIIDTAAGITPSMLTFCEASKEVMVVVCDEPTSISDAYATIRVLNQEHGVQRFRVVANKIESSQQGLELYNKLARIADQELDVLLDFSGSIPLDAHLQKSVREQSAVVSSYPRSRAALAFKKLASRVNRWPKPDNPDGHLEFFVERLLKISNKVR